VGAGNYTFRIWLEGGDTWAMRETINEFARKGAYRGFSDKVLGLFVRIVRGGSPRSSPGAPMSRKTTADETGRQRTT
jgi:hypothetical protein